MDRRQQRSSSRCIYRRRHCYRRGQCRYKDIPSGVIAAGNPCRVIRKITEEDIEFYFKDRKFDAQAFEIVKEAAEKESNNNQFFDYFLAALLIYKCFCHIICKYRRLYTRAAVLFFFKALSKREKGYV